MKKVEKSDYLTCKHPKEYCHEYGEYTHCHLCNSSFLTENLKNDKK